jgi:hypothetical protein
MSVRISWAEFGTQPDDPRYGRPVSDTTVGGWSPSEGTDLYAMVDESAVSDADYVTTSTASTCELALTPVTDPATSTGQVVTIRAKSVAGSTLVATLKQPDIPGYTGGLFLPRRWNRAPQMPVEIDTGNYFARRIDPPMFRAKGLPVAIDGKYGEISNIANSGGFTFKTPWILYSTVFLLFKLTSVNTWSSILKSSTNYIRLYTCAGSTTEKFLTLRGAVGLSSGNIHSSIPLNTWVLLSASVINGGIRLFSDGKLIDAVSASPQQWNGGSLTVGDAEGTINAKIAFAAYWPGWVFSDTEHLEFAKNPWQIFKPRKQISYFSVPSTPGTIATRTFSSLGSSFADYQMTLTTPECDAITDYNNLSITLEAQ